MMNVYTIIPWDLSQEVHPEINIIEVTRVLHSKQVVFLHKILVSCVYFQSALLDFPLEARAIL